MSPELFIFAFAIATGYVAAGLTSSLYSLLTSRPASFQNLPDSLAERLLHVPIFVIGGPFILLRNALRGRIIEGRPVSWLALSSFIVVGWSFISGLFVLHLALMF